MAAGPIGTGRIPQGDTALATCRYRRVVVHLYDRIPRVVPVLIIFKVEISVASTLEYGAGGTGAQVMRADARGGVVREARSRSPGEK